MGRRNVVVLTTSYPIGGRSTSGIFISRLLEAMPEDTRITVLTPATTTYLPASGPKNIQIREFRYAPRRWQTLAHNPGGIPVALRENRALYLLLPLFLASMFFAVVRASRNTELIHANWSICGFIAGLASRLHGVPVITTLRGEDLNRAITSPVYDFLVRSTLRSNSRIVTVSNAFESHIAKRYPEFRRKCQTISNGVADEFMHVGATRGAATADVNRVPDKPLRLLTVGSLIRRKGIDVVLRALAALSCPQDVVLSIVGDGTEKWALHSLAIELGISEQMRFLGQKEPSEIADILRSHDVFVLASHSEGRPNVVLEAKAAALTVVASNIEGVREIIDHEKDGLLFEDNAHDQLAQQIEQLLQNPENILRYGTKAHASILNNNLTWQHSAQKYASVYRDMVSV